MRVMPAGLPNHDPHHDPHHDPQRFSNTVSYLGLNAGHAGLHSPPACGKCQKMEYDSFGSRVGDHDPHHPHFGLSADHDSEKRAGDVRVMVRVMRVMTRT